jgi:hypothetical protein
MELVLPSGRRVRVKLKKQEFGKIEDEIRLYQHPKVERTFRQKVKFFWTRKVKVAWIRIKEWVKRKI